MYTPNFSPNINFQIPGVSTGGPLKSVSSTLEALQTPGLPGSQDVLLDTNDPEIAYFRQIDSGGNVAVDRRRCVAEAEPTIEEIADQKYVSKTDFDKFREEWFRSVRELKEELNRNVADFVAAATAEPDAGNAEADGRDEKPVIHAAKRPKPSGNASAAG